MIDFRMRRVRWLVGGAVALVFVVAATLHSGRSCSIIVYNESEDIREGVSVIAPGFAWRVPSLPPRGSRRSTVTVNPANTTYLVHLGRAGDPGHEIWFEPRAGRQLIVRIWQDGLIETDVRPAWWE